MTTQNSGRSMHVVTFSDSQIAFLKKMVTYTLREINQMEQELKTAENEVWAKCKPDSKDVSARIAFNDLNLIRDAKRQVQKKKRKYESVQVALRDCVNLPA